MRPVACPLATDGPTEQDDRIERCRAERRDNLRHGGERGRFRGALLHQIARARAPQLPDCTVHRVSSSSSTGTIQATQARRASALPQTVSCPARLPVRCIASQRDLISGDVAGLDMMPSARRIVEAFIASERYAALAVASPERRVDATSDG